MATLQLHCLRHAESTANAGQVTYDLAAIPLTERGRQQAVAIAESWLTAPDLVVTSPYLRTRQTAAPTLARFCAIAEQIWPIQEFTYLSPTRCAGTTREQRLPWVATYWELADPGYTDDATAESFAMLIARVEASLARLAHLHAAIETTEHMNNASGRYTAFMFGHGQFLQALRWLIAEKPALIDANAMRAFRACDLAAPLQNGSGFILELAQGHWTIVADQI